MTRVLRACLVLFPLLPSGEALAAKMVEQDGYHYVQISLGGLWGGFFVFLFGIVFCLVGLFLFILWRRSLRHEVVEPVGSGTDSGEDDGRVF